MAHERAAHPVQMTWLHGILNFTCLLLWLNWRSIALAHSPARFSPKSLLSTLRKATDTTLRRWIHLVILLLILLVRPFLYFGLRHSTDWTPVLFLGVVEIPFQSDHIGSLFLFSLLSFLVVLILLYLCLFYFSALFHKVNSMNPWVQLVQAHLGWMDLLPRPTKWMAPFWMGGIAWLVLSPGLVYLELLPEQESVLHWFQQALVLGLASFLAWKWLLISIALLYWLEQHVYLGKQPFWKLVRESGGKTLKPMKGVLSWNRFDLTPALFTVLIFFLAKAVESGLVRLFNTLPL